jgi:hypothetical protein
MTPAQLDALARLHEAYRVPFDPEKFTPQFDLPDGYVAGWVGDRLYVGCSPEGRISS